MRRARLRRAARTHSADAHHCAACGRRGRGCACPRRPPAGGLPRRCPTCRAESAVDVGATVFTGAECAVCADVAPAVVFPACRHATVCAACVARLAPA